MRRGAALAHVAAASTVLIGFAALAIDIGYLYDVKAELQRTADAAALAAAQDLCDYGDGDPLDLARQTAVTLSAQNKTARQPVLLDPASDVVFGRASWNDNYSKYDFEQTTEYPNAVRVRARRTADSPSGAIPLFFAKIFGKATKDMQAEATAVLTPRDIVFVLDLSGSHNDDTCLRSYRNPRLTNLQSRDVWSDLWDTATASAAGITRPTENGLESGPYFGNMRAWGENYPTSSWNFAADTGLINLPKNSNWALTAAQASVTLAEKGKGTYNAAEMSVINSKNQDGNNSIYQRRVLVGLGVYRWKSGKAGGQAGGNGDNIIDSNEIEVMVPYPSSTSNPSSCCKKMGGSWTSFVDYVASSSSNMCQYNPSTGFYGNSGLRYKFGIKTLADYWQEKCTGDSVSPGLAGAREQPMGAVVDATQETLNIVDDLQSNDLVGMAGYGTVGYGPSDKPNNLSWLIEDTAEIRSKVETMQAAMWTANTNIAQGIDKGVDVLLNSPNSRRYSAKIMLLLTDGQPNQTRANPTQYASEYSIPNPAAEDALVAAQEAHDLHGIRIYTISVGGNSNLALMDEIASVGAGEHFHAEGSVSEYTQQLRNIFQRLGGKRPVELVATR